MQLLSEEMSLRSFILIVGVCSCGGTTLDSYDDGALFDKCIDITDWESASLSSSITLTDRDSNGCCASGTVPGQFHTSHYYGAQVICGFEDDGGQGICISSSSGSYTCDYKNCFVHKQNLTCDDGSAQKLNGCCSSSSCSQNNCNYDSCCKNYYNSMSNVWGNDTTYCRTYDKDWGSTTGNQGLYYYDGTKASSDDVNTSGNNNSLNVGYLQMYIGCPASSEWSSSTTSSSSTVTTLDSYEDGALFDKCIKITDWVSANLSSSITLTDRDSYGCCASDEVPGQYHSTSYYGAQVICGFKDDGSREFTTSSRCGTSYSCTYNNCFVHKQNLPCADGSGQLLNGCCSSSSCSQNNCNFETDCKNYYTSMSNAQGASTTYCRTYDTDWASTTGNQGLSYYDGTTSYTDDVNTSGSEASLNTDNLQMYVACDGESCSCDTNTKSVSEITLDSYDDGALFDKCVKITDWETATLSSTINVTDRDSNGCCACDEVPGQYHSSNYYGAQIICGFEADGSRYLNTGSSSGACTCTYNKCFVHKQNLTCANGSQQLLNGCCASSSCSQNDCNFADGCRNYATTFYNAQGASTSYCRTYDWEWAYTKGDQGLAYYDGTYTTSDDVNTTGTDSLITDNLQMYISCDGSYGTSSSTRSTYCGSSSSSVSTITLDSYDDGALFDKCIKITDWVSATLSSEINVTDRDSNGCCACDEVPGLYHNADYYSAQVICGFEDDGSRSFSTSLSNYAYTCTYNNCYVHKQDFDCADGSKQLLNGCCSNSSCADNDCNFETTDCKNYYNSMSNAQGYSTAYCRTYHRNWASSTGNEGLAGYDGTTSTADDITASGNTTTLDIDRLKMYVGCEHTDDSSTHSIMKLLFFMGFFVIGAST